MSTIRFDKNPASPQRQPGASARPWLAPRARWILVLALCLCHAHLALAQAPAPAMVTLTAKQLPLTKVLADIAQKTGITVENQLGDPEPLVSLDLPATPFWKAIDQLADRIGARVTIQPRDGRVVLSRRSAEARPPVVSYSGPFRFCVKRIEESLDLDTGARMATAKVEVAWEPGLKPLFLETFPQNVVVVDDTGGRHVIPDMGKSKAPVDGRTSLMIDVPLPTLPRTVSRLVTLPGQLEVITPSKMVRFAFPKIEEGLAITLDGVTCKITRVALSKDRWTVQVSIENPPGGTILESYQPWDSNNVMALESKDHKTRIVANSYVRESQSSRRATISYHFTDRVGRLKPEEWSLTYRTPALIVTVPLTFSFKDVPLR